MTYFWTLKIFSGAISNPINPREKIIPSAASRISEKLFKAVRLSILARIFVDFNPTLQSMHHTNLNRFSSDLSNKVLHVDMSSAFLQRDRLIK